MRPHVDKLAHGAIDVVTLVGFFSVSTAASDPFISYPCRIASRAGIKHALSTSQFLCNDRCRLIADKRLACVPKELRIWHGLHVHGIRRQLRAIHRADCADGLAHDGLSIVGWSSNAPRSGAEYRHAAVCASGWGFFARTCPWVVAGGFRKAAPPAVS